MKLKNFIQKFLVENEEGLKQLFTYFLNQVMEYEQKNWLEQIITKEEMEEKHTVMEQEKED